MTKSISIVAAVAVSMATLALPAKAHGVSDRVASWLGAHTKHENTTWYNRKYGTTYERGFPADCAMLSERAHLTDHAYWHYAAARCRYSRHSYH